MHAGRNFQWPASLLPRPISIHASHNPNPRALTTTSAEIWRRRADTAAPFSTSPDRWGLLGPPRAGDSTPSALQSPSRSRPQSRSLGANAIENDALHSPFSPPALWPPAAGRTLEPHYRPSNQN